jgi:tetratricopeptide (TPR) repeat protein
LFQKAVEIDPQYARAHAWSTCSLANLQDWPSSELVTDDWLDKAFYHIDEAIRIDPDDAEANRIMGYAKLFFDNDFISAEAHYRKAHQMSPSDVHLALNLVSFCIFSGNMTEAKDLIEEIKVLNPYGSDQQFYLEGLIGFLEGNFDETISLLCRISNPDLMGTFLLTATYFKTGNQAETTKNFDKLLKKHGRELILEELSSLPFKEKPKKEEIAQLFEQIDSLAI